MVAELLNIPHAELFLLLLIAIGILAGFFSGLLGIGGGLVFVPGFYFGMNALGYEPSAIMHVAVGTSLAGILPTGLSSALAHWKRGAVKTEYLKKIGPGTFAGALIGVFIASHVESEGLQLIFGLAVMLVAFIMFMDPKRYAIFTDVPGRPWPALIGAAIGILASLMGIAGGLLCIPFLTVCRVSMHNAVGTASAIGPTISLPAAIGFIGIGLGTDVGIPFTLGYVSIPALLIVVPFSVMMAPIGAKVAHSISVDRLRRVFAVFMVIIAVRMLMALSS